MDLDYVLLWMVLISSGLAVVRLLGARPRPNGWLGVHLAILATTVLGALLLPQGAGLIGGVLWCLLFLVPVRLIIAMQRATLARDFARAARMARWASRLHPFDGYRESPEMVAALALVDQGRFAEAEHRLRASPQAARAVARTALTQSFRQRADWEGALEWFPLPADESGFRQLADEVLLHVRALGETGNLLRLAWILDRVDAAFERGRRELERNGLRAMVLAFAGRIEPLERLLQGPLQLYPADLREYWRAVAAEAQGQAAGARERFERLAASGSLLTRAASARRLAQPLGPAQLPDALLPALERIERELDQEQRFGVRAEGRQAPPRATRGIIFATLLYFLLEIAGGGSENPATLIRLGALLPGRVLAGEWWRLLAAMFLHFGWLHFAMNMYGLWLLGPFVERSVGRLRFLALYLVSGLGSMAGVVALVLLNQIEVDLMVGASGAIMGVVGATAAILLRGWLVERAPVAGRRLASIGLIIALQITFDKLTPMVSGAAHLWGLVLGFLWTLAVEALVARRGG